MKIPESYFEKALAASQTRNHRQAASRLILATGHLHFATALQATACFEIARLKRWKFGARTETMTAQQRALFFQDTLAKDEVSLQAQLAKLQHGPPKAECDRPMQGDRTFGAV